MTPDVIIKTRPINSSSSSQAAILDPNNKVLFYNRQGSRISNYSGGVGADLDPATHDQSQASPLLIHRPSPSPLSSLTHIPEMGGNEVFDEVARGDQSRKMNEKNHLMKGNGVKKFNRYNEDDLQGGPSVSICTNCNQLPPHRAMNRAQPHQDNCRCESPSHDVSLFDSEVDLVNIVPNTADVRKDGYLVTDDLFQQQQYIASPWDEAVLGGDEQQKNVCLNGNQPLGYSQLQVSEPQKNYVPLNGLGLVDVNDSGQYKKWGASDLDRRNVLPCSGVSADQSPPKISPDYARLVAYDGTLHNGDIDSMVKPLQPSRLDEQISGEVGEHTENAHPVGIIVAPTGPSGYAQIVGLHEVASPLHSNVRKDVTHSPGRLISEKQQQMSHRNRMNEKTLDLNQLLLDYRLPNEPASDLRGENIPAVQESESLAACVPPTGCSVPPAGYPLSCALLAGMVQNNSTDLKTVDLRYEPPSGEGGYVRHNELFGAEATPAALRL